MMSFESYREHIDMFHSAIKEEVAISIAELPLKVQSAETELAELKNVIDEIGDNFF